MKYISPLLLSTDPQFYQETIKKDIKHKIQLSISVMESCARINVYTCVCPTSAIENI